MFKVRDSRKNFLRKFAFIGVACWGMCIAILGYSLYNSAWAPNEESGKVVAMSMKDRVHYITRLQYALIMTLPFLGIGSLGLTTLLSSRKLGLFEFEFRDS